MLRLMGNFKLHSRMWKLNLRLLKATNSHRKNIEDVTLVFLVVAAQFLSTMQLVCFWVVDHFLVLCPSSPHHSQICKMVATRLTQLPLDCIIIIALYQRLVLHSSTNSN